MYFFNAEFFSYRIRYFNVIYNDQSLLYYREDIKKVFQNFFVAGDDIGKGVEANYCI